MTNLKQYHDKALCFWSWNGNMEALEIKEQISQFANGRFGGLIIHSRAGLTIPYMGDKWFHSFEIAVKEAERLGLDVWIYDEDGWPSGFSGGKVPALGEKYCLKRLKYGFKKMQAEQGTIIAIFRCCNENEYIRIPHEDSKDGDLFFWYIIDRFYVDLLYPDTVKQFLKLTHEKYKEKLGNYFGRVIKGVFTDEPQLNFEGFPWSNELAAKFESTYHYNMLDLLWLFVVRGNGYRGFRYDFWKLINRMFSCSFTQEISNWCVQNGLVMTGHFSSEDGLCDQIAGSGGVMTNYEYMQLPGIDHLGNRLASPVLMKQVASIANQIGTHNVLSETFGCSGWGLTFSQLCWIWGWQSVLGVTVPCFHLAAYTIQGTRKRDYPAFFSYQEPWWAEFSALMKWINGMNGLMKEGRRLVHTLVIPPIFSVMCEYESMYGDRTQIKKFSNQFRLLLENLLDIQQDFEIGDEQILAKYAVVENGEIRIQDSYYDSIFVAESISIDESTLKLLSKFSEQGGKLIFVNERPFYTDCRLQNRIDEIEAYDVQNRRDMLEKLISFIGVQRVVEIRNQGDMKIARGFVIHTRILEDQLRIHLWYGMVSSTTDVLLSVVGDVSLYKIDPVNGKREELPSFYDKNGSTSAYLTISPKENMIVETGERKPTNIERVLKNEQLIENINVKLSHNNCLTIDKAAFSINGGVYTDEMPVINIVDLLYASAVKEHGEINVALRYRFQCNMLNIQTQDITLAIEDEHCNGISINNLPLSKGRLGWWLDKCIGEYPINDLLRYGENYVVVYYRIPKIDSMVDINEAFETERNRFYYPVEPESIYIRGNFDIVTTAIVADRTDHYSVNEDTFTLKQQTIKKIGDLTVQNLWFYRGDAVYEFTLENMDTLDKRIAIVVKKHFGTLLQLEINGHIEYLFSPPFETDITDLLVPGENIVRLRLFGSNRNLLGPHHHINGENYFVGPSTFKGIKGFEDFVTPSIKDLNTWTDNYSFIPFGIYEVFLKEYEVKRC